jgi:hypothetical protein
LYRDHAGNFVADATVRQVGVSGPVVRAVGRTKEKALESLFEPFQRTSRRRV